MWQDPDVVLKLLVVHSSHFVLVVLPEERKKASKVRPKNILSVVVFLTQKLEKKLPSHKWCEREETSRKMLMLELNVKISEWKFGVYVLNWSVLGTNGSIDNDETNPFFLPPSRLFLPAILFALFNIFPALINAKWVFPHFSLAPSSAARSFAIHRRQRAKQN